MAKCNLCKSSSNLISEVLGLCLDCIRTEFKNALPYIEEAHRKTRKEFHLPIKPPKAPQGLSCNLCINSCQIPPGEMSYCGLRKNLDNRLKGVTTREGNLSFYYDTLPTNCVADWVCDGGKPYEYGYKNLAVFYIGCSFNCLFCQNWHYREKIDTSKRFSAKDVAFAADERTHCICYFGGDPTVQLTHSILTSRIALKRKGGRTLRICWETNGSMNPKFLNEMFDIALTSGGCIKFDLKAWSEEVNIALCAVTNKQSLENIQILSSRIKERPQPPPLVVSTLLVPGYVDEREVEGIAKFLAGLNPEIPYSLLAFHPQFYMSDLPTTSRRHAESCLQIAKKAGLKNLRIGNVHLLDLNNKGIPY